MQIEIGQQKINYPYNIQNPQNIILPQQINVINNNNKVKKKKDVPFREWNSKQVSKWLEEMDDPKMREKIMFKRMKRKLSKKTGMELANYNKSKLNDMFGECGILLYKKIKKIDLKKSEH